MKETSQKMDRAVIVTRVSTGEQVKHGCSLESQLEQGREKASSLNLPIFAEYEDAGISGGSLLMRAGMQSALADIREGRANILICANISRYSRDVEHQQAIKKAVRAAGGRVIFCDMDFEDTPEGDLNFTIQGGFAEYERKSIRVRTMKGKRKRAEQGQQPQRSRSPYGYHIVTNAEVECGIYPADMRGRYVIDEATSKTATRLFDGYASGTESLSSLCKKLNTEGIPSPGGGVWHAPTVQLILTNPVYRGQPVSGRQKCHTDENRLQQVNALTGAPITRPEVRRLVPEDEQIQLSSPALVSNEVWDAVQGRLGMMKAKHGGNPKRMRMLSGLCYCPHCGERAVTKYQQANGKTYSYYWCSSRQHSRDIPGERPCKGDLYPIDIVEKATLSAVQDAWQHPEALASALAVYKQGNQVTGNTDALRGELAALDEALSQIKEEEMAAVQAQIAGIRAGASPDLYAEVFAQLAGRRKDMEDRRGTLTTSLSRPSRSPKARVRQADEMFVSQALEEAMRALTSEHTTGQEKRVLLGTVVDKVIAHKEGADVIFAQSIMNSLGSGNDTGSGRSLDTFHTTCIGIKTHK